MAHYAVQVRIKIDGFQLTIYDNYAWLQTSVTFITRDVERIFVAKSHITTDSNDIQSHLILLTIPSLLPFDVIRFSMMHACTKNSTLTNSKESERERKKTTENTPTHRRFVALFIFKCTQSLLSAQSICCDIIGLILFNHKYTHTAKNYNEKPRI